MGSLSLPLPAHGFCATHVPDGWEDSPAGRILRRSARVAAELPAADTLPEATVVDVMFLYTPLALAAEGSEAGLRRRVETGVEETNLRLANSGVNVRVQPVFIGLYNTFESGSMPREMSRLGNAVDGFERVPQLRNDYQADLVCLVTELDTDNYLAGAWDVAPTLGDPQFAYLIIRRQALATGSRVLAHEFGHLFGCAHDREHAGNLQSTFYQARKPYIFAHRTQVEGVTYIDLMSYEPGIFVPYYSSPRVSIDGVPMGVPADQARPSDGARTINEVAPYVARYRTAVSRVEFARASFVGRREESRVTVILRRSGDLNSSTRVNVVFDPASPARPGADYQRPTSTLVTFGTNQATAELVIPLVQDSSAAGERLLLLGLGSVLGAHGVGRTASATVAIHNPDTPSWQGDVEFTGGRSVIPETAGDARIAVRLPGNDPAGPIQLPYRTVDGTARAGIDYTAVSGTLDHPGAPAEWEIAVPIRNRPEAGPDRTFAIVVGTRTNEVRILDTQRPGSLRHDGVPAVEADGGMNLLVRGDGRLLVWGNFSQVNGQPRSGVALLHPDGRLDESFRPPELLLGHRRMPGLGTTESQTTNAALQVVRPQPDGRLLVAGVFSRVNGQPRRTLLRLQADGAVDESLATLDFDGAVNDVLVQPDGRILVGGTFTRLNGESRPYLARLYSDGSIDRSFQPQGGPTSEFAVSILALAQQSDGRLLIGGLFRKVDGAAITNVARLNPNGTLDTTFRLTRGASSPVTAVRVLEGDRILVAGFFETIGTRSSPRLARLLPDGTVDPTFRSPNPDAEIRDLFPLPDGRLVISGRFTRLGSLSRRSPALLQADGSVDPDFDPGLGPDVAPGIAAAFASRALAVTPDGTLWVAGEFNRFNGLPSTGLARLQLGEVPAFLGRTSRDGEGQIQSTLSGLPGGRYLLDTSPDLKAWNPAREVRLEGYESRAHISLPIPGEAGFLRLRSLAPTAP